MCTSMMALFTTITEAADLQRQAVEQREAFLHSPKPLHLLIIVRAYRGVPGF